MPHCPSADPESYVPAPENPPTGPSGVSRPQPQQLEFRFPSEMSALQIRVTPENVPAIWFAGYDGEQLSAVRLDQLDQRVYHIDERTRVLAVALLEHSLRELKRLAPED